MSGLSDMLLIVVNGKNIYWPLETFTLVWSRSHKHKTKQTKANKKHNKTNNARMALFLCKAVIATKERLRRLRPMRATQFTLHL